MLLHEANRFLGDTLERVLKCGVVVGGGVEEDDVQMLLRRLEDALLYIHKHSVKLGNALISLTLLRCLPRLV